MEKTVIVCDECGTYPAAPVRISVNGRNREKDLCGDHVATILAGTRPPRRGRRRKAE